MKKNIQSGMAPAHTAWRKRWIVLALSSALAMVPPMQSAYAQDPSANQASLNFVNADIDSVVKAIGHYTNTNFIIDPRVKGTVNLVSEKPVTKAQAFQLLTTALRMQGYAVVAGDGFTKVVPEADAKLQAGPIQRGQVRGDQVATQIFRLNYESAANMVPVLRPLISPNNTINANPGTNSLVITDYADNLRRLSRIISALDAPATADMDVVPIRHAIATDIAVMVNRLLEQGGAPGAADPGRINLLADSRTNSVIIRAPSSARASLAKSLIAKLDQPTSMPGNVHVVYLKNAEAARLAQTLRAVVASDASATGAAVPVQTPAQNTPQTNNAGLGGGNQSGGMQAPPASPAPQQGPLPTGGVGGFIQADPATNTLIITASEPVYRNLRAVIDQLDARRAQVYIESLIVEVSANRAAEFGVQWAGLSGDEGSRYRIGTLTGFSEGGNNLITQVVGQLARNTGGAAAAAATAVPGNGLNLGIFRTVAGQLSLGAIARALETDDSTNILSMPNLITLDNEEARIIVGQNVPFITGQFTTAASGGAAGVNPFQTIERKDIGLSLRVRPQISEGGTVKMAIYQETSAIQDNIASGLITTKRALDTNVLVDDGQIIVLGGLIDDNAQDGVEKVPGLGDIPVLGNLFKYKTRGRQKTNLMIFLRPTVIRSNEQSVNVASDRYNYIRNAQVTAQPEQTMVLPNLGGPVLPPLENGRLAGSGLLNITPAALEGTAQQPSGVPQQQMPQAPAMPSDPQPMLQ
ncbi:type II secretion system secretin GspD [Oxalobacteraceae bacterium R-40]|uniref:Type II secretion system secretin GspD n=1 Tax=Keguizhuia sedimenti TaxID=3064264 RepID=A0ABU1BJN5_9BURK|nr:type II secretion system secretin GspD [Oxalobacteraceae bacterium R-40]